MLGEDQGTLKIRSWQREIGCWKCGSLLRVGENDIEIKQNRNTEKIGNYFVECEECCTKLEIDIFGLPPLVAERVTKRTGEFEKFEKEKKERFIASFWSAMGNP